MFQLSVKIIIKQKNNNKASKDNIIILYFHSRSGKIILGGEIALPS
jgi:hypothetical protein